MGLPHSAGSFGPLREGWPSFPRGYPCPSTPLLAWLGEGGVRLGMNRSLVLTHPSSLIPGLATSLGDMFGEFPLGCGETPAEDWACWARQEGSSSLVPAIRHTHKPAARRPAQSCPVVRAAVVIRGGGYSQSHRHPAAWSQWLWPPPFPPHCPAQVTGSAQAELWASQVRVRSSMAFDLKSPHTPIRQMHRLDQQIPGYSERGRVTSVLPREPH